jgi:predicted ArsR family transcriptional regulator
MIDHTVTVGQYYLLELILQMQQPFTLQRLVDRAASEQALETNPTAMRMRLNKLVKMGWLTRGPSIATPGVRGKPPIEYALVAGAAHAWEKRERELQAFWREQREREEGLLA